MKTKSIEASAGGYANAGALALLLSLVSILTGCATDGSPAKVDRPEASASTTSNEVKLYKAAPANYTSLQWVFSESYPAGNSSYLRFAVSDLKKQAARRGANGLVLIEAVQRKFAANNEAQPPIYREDFITTQGYARPRNQTPMPNSSETTQLAALAIFVPKDHVAGKGAATWANLPPFGSSDWSAPEFNGTKKLKSDNPTRPNSS